jgi:hypothetical protein
MGEGFQTGVAPSTALCCRWYIAPPDLDESHDSVARYLRPIASSLGDSRVNDSPSNVAASLETHTTPDGNHPGRRFEKVGCSQ